ncbi:hypothetical protein SKAU_G00355960 [Synaphobranchus kaupii]|uniref:Uncharacterized protein n=1 Tax=Synaphobranchus kaupii TaxID=118154 RepID=A0A9Q1EHD5_SYNKA|nr:hypothetical protein SKAU_G00355960 [Synaphobranchus kaupii]
MRTAAWEWGGGGVLPKVHGGVEVCDVAVSGDAGSVRERPGERQRTTRENSDEEMETSRRSIEPVLDQVFCLTGVLGLHSWEVKCWAVREGSLVLSPDCVRRTACMMDEVGSRVADAGNGTAPVFIDSPRLIDRGGCGLHGDVLSGLSWTEGLPGSCGMGVTCGGPFVTGPQIQFDRCSFSRSLTDFRAGSPEKPLA